MSHISLAFLIPLAFPACTPKYIARDYSRFSGCPIDKVVVLENEQAKSDRYRASGCGHGVEFYCEGEECISPEISIATRHGRQFGCPPRDVVVEDLKGGAWQGKGCGHVLTYQCIRSEEHVLRCIAETGDETNRGRRLGGDE